MLDRYKVIRSASVSCYTEASGFVVNSKAVALVDMVKSNGATVLRCLSV